MIHDFKYNGFIALTSILIIGALVLTIGIGVSLRSTGESLMSLAGEQVHRALSLAQLCAEQALLRLESVLQYQGNESIMMEGESCDILRVEGTGNLNRVIKTRSTVFGYTRKIKVVISQISPVMRLSSWKEVPDF